MSTRTLGIRLAPGRDRGDLSRQVVQQGGRRELSGTLIGPAAGPLLTPILAALPYGVRPE